MTLDVKLTKSTDRFYFFEKLKVIILAFKDI